MRRRMLTPVGILVVAAAGPTASACGSTSGVTAVDAGSDALVDAAAVPVDVWSAPEDATAAVGCDGYTALAVTPAFASVMSGQMQLFTATGSCGGRRVGDPLVAWTSSDDTIASIGSSGLATALRGPDAGCGSLSATIIATDPVTHAIATAQLDIIGEGLTPITISPGVATIPLGGTEQFTATADFCGTPMDLTNAPGTTWTSSTTTVATISDTGLVTAVAPGTTIINVSNSGLGATATLIVTSDGGTLVDASGD